jgi:alanyl-tRNA synthetase
MVRRRRRPRGRHAIPLARGRVTERLYYTDAYLRTFDAHAVDVADGGRRVYLDRTAFYPTSGGQPHDTGELGGARVVDVIDDEDRIAHVLDSPIAAGPVTGAVDWDRRFDHMQQHTGQHVLSSVLDDLFGHATVSVHFGDATNTLDLDVGAVDRETLIAAERRANEIVCDDVTVAVSFVDAASAAGLRKPSDRPGELRVVEIEGIDRSACGGTHVLRTGEIGPILLRRMDRVRGAARIEFVCGLRAVVRARQDYDTLAAVANAASASLEDAPARVVAIAEQLREAGKARKRLAEELSVHRARALYEAAPADANGNRWIEQSLSGAEFADARAIAHAVTSLPRAAYLATSADPPRILLATSDDSGLDAGALLERALAAAGGRGGGSARIAQGSVPDAKTLVAALAALR